MVPCTNCLEHEFKCVALPDNSKVCAACLKARRKECDVAETSNSGLDKLDREQARLEAEESATFAALQTAAAKLERLRRQQRFLKERRSRMIRMGFDSLEELERSEAEGSSGGSPDPENSEGSLLKRPRHESVDPAAPQAAESAGEPGAEVRSPRSPEPVNSARLSPFVMDPTVLEGFPSFSFGDDLVSVGGRDFDGGIL